MDVKLYGTRAAGKDYSCYRTAPSAPEPVRRQKAASTGSYDRLTLHQTQYPSDPNQFARILAREAAKEVATPVEASRVEELRSQVAAGTYVPDADRIARHMLCCF